MAAQQSEKKIKISLSEYLEKNISLSEMHKFAFSKSFKEETEKSFEDWIKFFEDK